MTRKVFETALVGGPISPLRSYILLKYFIDFVIILCIYQLVRWNCADKIAWLFKIKDLKIAWCYNTLFLIFLVIYA